MGETVLSTISFSFWILWGIVFIVFLALVISVIHRNLQTRRAPVKKVNVRVKRLEYSKGPVSPVRGTFMTQEDEQLMLFIDQKRASPLYEGQEGLLTYKGNTFISLESRAPEV